MSPTAGTQKEALKKKPSPAGSNPYQQFQGQATAGPFTGGGNPNPTTEYGQQMYDQYGMDNPALALQGGGYVSSTYGSSPTGYSQMANAGMGYFTDPNAYALNAAQQQMTGNRNDIYQNLQNMGVQGAQNILNPYSQQDDLLRSIQQKMLAEGRV